MFYSTGKLAYFTDPYKLIVEVDQNISDYYRSLIPKYIPVKKQMYNAHISVVRNETPINIDMWGKYDALPLTFEYESFIYNDELYYWLNAYSAELEEIRIELGLTKMSDITRPPDHSNKFHITIGNLKNSRTP